MHKQRSLWWGGGGIAWLRTNAKKTRVLYTKAALTFTQILHPRIFSPGFIAEEQPAHAISALTSYSLYPWDPGQLAAPPLGDGV